MKHPSCEKKNYFRKYLLVTDLLLYVKVNQNRHFAEKIFHGMSVYPNRNNFD